MLVTRYSRAFKMATKAVFPAASTRHFSAPQSTTSASSSDDELIKDQLRQKIDPIKGQVADFLKNVNTFEQENLDVEKTYFMADQPLKGLATAAGTDKYYRMS